MSSDEGRVEVIVKLVPEGAPPDSEARQTLQACAARMGISLEPLHASTNDRELATYFVAHVDPATLSGVVEQLQKCKGVDGAYAKPRGEAP